MGEKRRNGYQDKSRKKYKVAVGIIEPSTSGIYATCNRRQEKKCQNELTSLFNEKLEEYYKKELESNEGDEDEGEEEEELSIEDSIKKELAGLKEANKPKTKTKDHVKAIDLGCECVVFIKTRRPIDPETFVERICKDAFDSKVKNTRFTQKLTPITFSVSASMEELTRLAKKVLAPHFHKEEGQKPHTFAIKITSRNFSVLEKDEMITKIASCVGTEHGHKVDLKKYEKLILVECFKNNIGMSVVNNYEKYSKFNLQQIFTKQVHEDDGNSRVKAANEAKEEAKPVEKKKEESKEESKENTSETSEPTESTKSTDNTETTESV